MIEIFGPRQTKSIAKQTNRDESLIIRSIAKIKYEYENKCEYNTISWDVHTMYMKSTDLLI